jgi:hypothetical protein
VYVGSAVHAGKASHRLFFVAALAAGGPAILIAIPPVDIELILFSGRMVQ